MYVHTYHKHITDVSLTLSKWYIFNTAITNIDCGKSRCYNIMDLL